MNVEKDFLVYIKHLKDLIQTVDDQNLACLAEEWAYKLIFDNEDANVRNYITYYLVHQFGSNNFRPWFNKENLLKPLAHVAEEIHRDLQQPQVVPKMVDTGGDSKTWGQMKFDRIQHWMEFYTNDASTSIGSVNDAPRSFGSVNDEEVTCLYKSNKPRICENISTTTEEQSLASMSTITSDIKFVAVDAPVPASVYQKFILDHIPEMLNKMMTGSEEVPAFACFEAHREEFSGYEQVIVDHLQTFGAKIKELECSRHLAQRAQTVEKGTETDQIVDEDYVRKLKEKFLVVLRESRESKKEIVNYMEDVQKKAVAINEVLERTRSRLEQLPPMEPVAIKEKSDNL